MSGALLMTRAIDMARAAFTRAEVAEVRAYAGEFSGEEVGQVSYNCPAVFVTCLGWRPEREGRRLTGRNVRTVQMAAFVAFKHASRDKRMAGAMNLADRLGLLLTAWVPTGLPGVLDVAGLEEDATAENLYGRAIDSKGQALWLVSWRQCVRPLVPPAQLYDLVAIEIEDTTQQGNASAGAPPPPAPLAVTEDVKFQSPI